MDYNMEERAAVFDSFVQILKELTDITARLTETENAKAQAASVKEHAKIDSFLKEEQALLLKFRGTEQQRIRKAADLGWKDFTFRQILEAADESEVSVLSPLFLQMERQLKDLSDAKDSSDRIVSVRLREFEHILGVNSTGSFPETNPYFHDRYV